jgi:hypothetical protein
MNHALLGLGSLFSRKAILPRGRNREAIFTRLCGGEQLERRAMLAAEALNPWHNAAQPMDVNADQNITALDALVVINRLNAGQAGPLTAVMPINRTNFMAAAGDSRPSYIDVNNDGNLTALDALTIINGLQPAQDETVRIRVDVTDANGNPIDTQSLSVGETFQLRGFVQDLRPPVGEEQRGIAAAYVDVNFDPAKIEVNGAITYSTDYDEGNNLQSQITATPGLLNEIGGANFFDEEDLDGTERLVFTVPFRVLAGGTLTITLDQSDVNEVVFAGADVEVPPEDIQYVGDEVTLGTPPTAADDTETGQEDATVELDVLDNDAPHPNGAGPLTIVAVSGVTPGALVEIINDGTAIRYRSPINFNGADTFTYTVRDANNEEDTAQVTVNVANVNDAPDANNDAFTINVNATQQVFDVLANDSTLPDPPGETLTIFDVTAVAPAGSGTVELLSNDTRIGFTPAAGFVGEVTFTYRARDNNGGESDPATGTVHVRNDNPTAGPDTATVAEGSTDNVIDVLVNDSLAPGATGPLMVIDVSAGSNGGTINIGGGGVNVLYTPATNFFGTETFTYRVADSDGGEATGTVTVTVTGVPDPALAIDDEFEVDEDSGETELEVLANDNAQNPDAPETYTITDVTQPANGTVEIAQDGASVLYTPDAQFFGSDTFTYTIMDDDGTPSTATVTVTVTEVNDPPVAVDDVVNDVLEDQTTPVEIDVLANDTTNEAGETLSIESFTPPAASMGTVTLSEDETKLLFTPAANFNGQATFNYIVSDGRGGTDEGTVTVNVTPVADPPDAIDDARTIAEDSGPVEIDVLANDLGGDVQLMNVTITTTQPSVGTVGLTTDGRRVVFTPANNFFGLAEFQYTIDGGQGLTDTAMVRVTVTAINDFPVEAIDDTLTVTEDTETVLDILANDIAENDEGPNEPLTITRVGTGATDNRTARGGTLVIIDNGTRLRYIPPSNNVLQDSFEYTVSDGTGTDQGTVTINITAVNDDPLGVADSFEVEADSELADNVFDVLANDIAQNPDGASEVLTIVSLGTPSDGGTVEIFEGKVRYAPAAGFSGDETFTYTVRDAGGLESQGTVTVEVGDLADDDTFDIDEDQTPQPIELNVTANDRPAATIQAGSIAGLEAAEGTATISSDGKRILFTPAANRNGVVTFTYTAVDGTETDTATVTVNIEAVNDPPASGQTTFDQFTINEDEVREFTPDDLLANDRNVNPDGAGETLTILDVGIDAAGENGQTNRGGTVEVLPNGNIRYTPPANNFIADGFRYKVSDGTNTAVVDVTIRFNEVNDPPTAVADTATVAQGGVITIDALANDTFEPDTENNQVTETPLTISGISDVVGGAAEIVTVNGRQQIRFTGAPNFTGAASINYTLRDARGGTATGTVNITVTPFVNSSLSGKVYVDADNDGVQDTGEVGIADVTIRLSGTDMFGAAVNLTAVTDGNGAYSFGSVVPGSYVITEVHPTQYQDGKETVGSSGGIAGLDQFFLALGSGQTGTGYNFGERGLGSSHIGRHLFFEP